MKVNTVQIPFTGAAAKTSAERTLEAKLYGVLIAFDQAATGDVVVNLVRDSRTVILGQATVTDATSVRVSFEAPLLLQPGDQIQIDATDANESGVAWVDYEY